MKLGINIVLGIILVVLAWKLTDSVYTEIHFNDQFEKRSDLIKARFDVFKNIQEKYKSQKGKFASSFDEIENFIEKDSFKIVTLKFLRNDAENEPVYDSSFFYVSVKDSMKLETPTSDLKFIPLSPEEEKFSIEAKQIEKGKYKVEVFMIEATYRSFLSDFADDRYDTTKYYRIGSLSEQTYAGNW